MSVAYTFEDHRLAKPDGFQVEIDETHERADIILNRPPYNIVSMPQRDQLRLVFETLDEDARVRIIVVRSVGEHFSSGGNIGGFMEASPETVSKLGAGVSVVVEKGAGESAGFTDSDYTSAGATIASAIMWPRIFLIVGAVDPELAQRLIIPLAASTIVAIAGALWLANRGRKEEKTLAEGGEKMKATNPLDLGTALRFGLILTAIMVAARAASAWAGASGLLLVAGISGLVDVDAISLSVATMSIHRLAAPSVAVGAILLAAVVNTLLKPAMALVIGGAPMGLRFLASSLAMIAACGAGWLLAMHLA